ncbi:hypothetical protein HBI56_150740 [Parastagonospora nodorum]|uniref:Uncharacterized protein n=1 Tax=Phaeosphaeria nodorum (strain SN15 / ATCC MYA-4574 / FGSC 10173) TaxID=321614 RepID=A0A7U2I8A9_PHANO|nr:hypothetical protein HBH56_183780 [Parastagonospora nodorum]QRD04113.1 hypothetical protein JI435_420730 [Parastagonospora nodorum SN15]KAH3926068.1 hypothetical protein HBH54_172930 [Parastagonospora nodorum]KAH3944814.1 hypothetical protein HBH53_152000 [Parastagonospora nodorum]KAH3962457.1 hypothetical protein HBH52_224430 [Parastagonospora nodorum]
MLGLDEPRKKVRCALAASCRRRKGRSLAIDWLAENPSFLCSAGCCVKSSRMHGTTHPSVEQWYNVLHRCQCF